MVLLDILAQLRTALQFRLSAIHVNHQLSPRAGDWAEFCAGLCRAHGLPLEIVPVTLDLQAGDSLEAVARNLRYQVLARSSADFLVLAHNLDDQAETLLLQLLRGCGVEGASAMAEENRRLLRPLLEIPRSALEHYARRRGLQWVEDESNLDTRFDRNFLRQRLLPLLDERFPSYRETLSRASRNFAESAGLQEELACQDAFHAIVDGKLSVPALALLSPSRAKNLLRHFLKLHGVPAPSAVRLDNALRQLLSARQDAQIRISLGAVELRRFQNQICLVPGMVALPSDWRHAWHGEDLLELAELGGALQFWPVRGQGISLDRLRREAVTVRVRQGGERLQPDCKRPRRSVKHLLQESGMPPWERERMPLLFSGEKLVAAMRLGVDCAYQARPDEAGILLEWHAR